MNPSYTSGYFKAILDLTNFFEHHSEYISYHCKTKKQLWTLIQSLLHYLLENSLSRFDFASAGGINTVLVSKDHEIISIKPLIE